jgi:hypothetical protein
VASQVIMDDGNENTIDDHMRDDNRKGARSMNDEQHSDMHRNPNPSQRKVEPTPGQPQPQQPMPAKDREKDAPSDDPARPPRKDTKRDPKRK